jgi:long-subunit acyl-CoA synthetase (AMP-forming)
MAGPKIYHSHIPDALIPNDLSFHQFLLRYNPDDAPDDKVIFEDFSPPKKQLTYGGLRQAAAVAAGTITRRYGLKEGDSVAVVGANSVNWALLAHAVIWFGGICV